MGQPAPFLWPGEKPAVLKVAQDTSSLLDGHGPSFDLPHVLSVIGGYKVLPELEILGRFTLTSGRPYTPTDADAAREQNRLVYDLSRVNEARSPRCHRLDLRADYRFNFEGWSLVTFFEAQNVYDWANVFQYVWNPKTRSRDTVNQIAFLPLGGVTVQI